MAQKATEKSPLRLLLNAEPFGFGPTAAIAGFFPHLRDHFETVGYMGKKHTLDLQRGLPYDAIHDMTAIDKEEREDSYIPVFEQYDVLLTAMDHKVMEEAQKAGLKTIYYDALAWYWPTIPDSVLDCDLYLAQDFFGVQERLSSTFARHADARTVPPIAPRPQQTDKRDHVLINLGGLQNPFWPLDEIVDYADTIITALKSEIPHCENIVISGSHAIADRLSHHGVTTYPRKDMEDALARSKMAFMTPGLGNIYDAAAFNIPTVWLPPANDSQGQQLRLIQKHQMYDGALDWSVFMHRAEIDYSAPQQDVLKSVANAANHLAKSEIFRERLAATAAQYYRQMKNAKHSNTQKLLQHFGTGGEEQVARAVIEKAKDFRHG